MNTYLPYADFGQSVNVLDNIHLNRMRADIPKILVACTELPSFTGKDNPIVKMWRGNEQALVRLGMAVCIEWAGRGNIENTMRRILSFKSPLFPGEDPEWLGDQAFHDSHKSFLLRSRPSHYRKFWPDFTDDLVMWWPRSPERHRVSTEEKQQERLVAKALKLHERLTALKIETHDAAIRAGLDPDTMEPMSDIEAEEELAAL